MVTVTENAKQQLKETLLANRDDPETGLRLSIKTPGQFGLVLDKEQKGDQVVEHDGLKVLLLGLDIVETLKGATLDTRDTPEGTKLVISRQ
jgi:Fe-S cluster assembly iron-binding protein IscA